MTTRIDNKCCEAANSATRLGKMTPISERHKVNIQWFVCCVVASALLIFIVSLISSTSAASATLSDIRKRDALKCGVNADLPGFSTTNSLDEYSGFETDLCRSVAAAALGDASKVECIPVSEGDDGAQFFTYACQTGRMSCRPIANPLMFWARLAAATVKPGTSLALS
jgi:hypothetical protein